MKNQTLKILNANYSLSYVTDLPTEDRGQCDRWKHNIKIDNELVDRQKATTTIHEVLHAIYFQMSMHNVIAGDSEEYIVDSLSKGLSTVLIDNPELMKQIQEGLK